MALAPPPAPRASRLGGLLVLALVLVLAYQLAHWTWVFLTPAPSAAAAPESAAVDLAAVSRLFGATAPPGSAPTSTGGLRLKGVVAPTPGVAASAIFSTGSGRDLAVFVEREVSPGVTLAEVHPDHVVLSRGGLQERLDLDLPRSAASASAPRGPSRPGFRLNVSKSGPNSFAISRKELDDALRDPNQLNYLGQLGPPTGQGVRMDGAPPGSLANKLGLLPGDVIRKVNGQAISSTGDLARLYTQFATLSLVQVEVLRGGTPVPLSYSIQP